VQRLFILSPANSGGKRARLLLSPNARFELARKLQRGETAALAEVFSFLSGLYFRGKFQYAMKFARVGRGQNGVLVITPDRGLVAASTNLTIRDIHSFGSVPISLSNPGFTEPFRRDALALARKLKPTATIVLLGSISTDKYGAVLQEAFGDRLLFPTDFVGRGDMSRGGLLLRKVEENRELVYQPLQGAIRRGKRPPKLAPPDKDLPTVPVRPREIGINFPLPHTGS
jgi:hypothetical protein